MRRNLEVDEGSSRCKLIVTPRVFIEGVSCWSVDQDG